ncbi:hypothetical protein [Paludibacterium denitrificans]|uniref:hypothetical protein n=1 Tax=Paludibacterium denitrificans TaxID=2675226 RepID=UPI001E5D574E|nr:hypothetical protein [Paludibacterium denitrificans]
MFGHLLTSVFQDGLSMDMERLLRINHTVSLLDSSASRVMRTPLRNVDVFMVNPSQSLESIAYKHIRLFPPLLRFLLSGVSGHQTAWRGTGNLFAV